MSSLHRFEQETIILWNNAESTCTIFTHDPRMNRRLHKLAAAHPGVYLLEKEGHRWSSFRLPKKLISVRAPFSEERRMKARAVAISQHRKPPIPKNRRR